MLLTLPLLLQATAIPIPPDFDLADIPSPDRCDARSSVTEIVVCGRRTDNGPLIAATDYVPPPEVPGPGIGYMVSDTVRANLFAQSVELPNGFISNRAMVTFTIPF